MPIWPIWPIFEIDGLDWQCCLAGSSKMAPRILILLIIPGAEYLSYTGGQYVLVDRPFYLVKWPQEKWACDFHDDATPLSFQLQITEDFF